MSVGRRAELAISKPIHRHGLILGVYLMALLLAAPAAAELALSQLIVEFRPGALRATDVEVTNNGDERIYVVTEPRELLRPGMLNEEQVTSPDPAKLGLLASPARFILEPGQRRTLRIAAIGTPVATERVYRVMVKPVAGDVSGDESGLKLLVGYDLLVIVRPSAVRNAVHAERTKANLTITNSGNASVELTDGEQCDATGKNCQALPAKRLYAGASWTQQLSRATSGEYRVRTTEGWSTLSF